MKVIQDNSKVRRCSVCESLLELEPSDIKMRKSTSYRRDEETGACLEVNHVMEYFTCPCCGKETFIEERWENRNITMI